MPLAYSGGFKQTVDELSDYEGAGLDIVFVPEAYTFDAVSQLGYLAARTGTVAIASGILNVYSRTPTLLAMTAAGLDSVSDGRFTLGLGASGPQVVEGFHGVPYTAPLARTREVVAICRQVWRRERVQHDGEHFHVPLTAEYGGSGLGKPLKLINTPVRERVPMVLAALGPKNVALAAELFEGWEPIFYFPERADAAFGDALREGLVRRSADLPPLDVIADTHLRICDNPTEVEQALAQVRRHLALYIGGMGARGKNFYNELAHRYGFGAAADAVQDLFLEGRTQEAALAVPDELVRGVSLIGSGAEVRERVEAFRAAGVGTLNARPLAGTHAERVKDVEQLAGFVA